MYNIDKTSFKNEHEFYDNLNNYLKGLLNGENNWLSSISNASALIYMLMYDINWAGFYLYKDNELILGPFQGNIACIRIPIGRGVCGIAAKTKEIQIVDDVTLFPGHIACDPVSQSEIVIPILKNNKLIGVLDIDSPIKNRFSHKDAEGLKKFVQILNDNINWDDIPK